MINREELLEGWSTQSARGFLMSVHCHLTSPWFPFKSCAWVAICIDFWIVSMSCWFFFFSGSSGFLPSSLKMPTDGLSTLNCVLMWKRVSMCVSWHHSQRVFTGSWKWMNEWMNIRVWRSLGPGMGNDTRRCLLCNNRNFILAFQCCTDTYTYTQTYAAVFTVPWCLPLQGIKRQT